LLRKHFVFKIIPCLNPDGVARGYYRLDTMCYNLNRFYLDPSKQNHPTIWAAKKAVVQQAENLLMFVDFHAHASKRGGFMFGNNLPDPNKQADNITFAKLVAMNCLNFDMNECNFSDRIMAIKDRNGQSREGSSRVALALATGITYCYTLEFNYHSGRRINTLAPKFIRSSGNIEPETEVTDPASKIYSQCASPPFTPLIWEDCGRAFGAALLDFVDDNPVSRIPLSCFRSVANVRTDIMNNLSKYVEGNVNVVGANHFAPTNTKVAKNFANTPVPKVGKTLGSAGNS
jgi:cytosolic carboxypeptidase protein 5